VTEQPANALAEASNWSEVMAKVIEFYLRGPVPKKVKPVPIEQRGKLVEFPKGKLRRAVYNSGQYGTRRRKRVNRPLLWMFLRASMNGVIGNGI
jgi:hypothetical protein